MGRKSKLTKKIINGVSKDISIGMYAKRACARHGIGESTYYEWLERAREYEDQGIENLYTEFAESIKRAEAEDQYQNLLLWNEGNERTKNPVGIGMKMGRRYKGEWNEQIVHTPELDPAIQIFGKLLGAMKKPPANVELESPKLLTEATGSHK